MFAQPLEGAKRALAALRSSIRFNQELRNALASGAVLLPAEFSVNPPHDEWKKLDHAVSVSQLYLIYESLVHECVSEWLEILSSLVPYNELTEKVRSTHREGIGYILQNLEGRRFNSISVPAMVKEYQEALSTATTYNLHADAFLLHDRNLKVDELQKMLSCSGLELQLADWFKGHRLISKHDSLQLIGHATVDKAINSLIDRRNEASHATRQVGEILGEDVLIAYIDFLDSFAEALVEGFLHSTLHLQKERGDWSAVGKINYVKPDAKNICVAPVESCTLSSGMTVYLRGKHFCCRAMIEELQLAGQSVAAHTIALQPVEVGLRLNIETFKGSEIFVQTHLPEKVQPLGKVSEDVDIQDAEMIESDAFDSDAVLEV